LAAGLLVLAVSASAFALVHARTGAAGGHTSPTSAQTTVARVVTTSTPKPGSATPTRQPTRPPAPTATPLPVSPSLSLSTATVTACVGGTPATFTVTLLGSAATTLTVTSASQSRFAVSLDGTSFGQQKQGPIAPGARVTVWVKALQPTTTPRTITVSVPALPHQAVSAQSTCGG
jgi:hypothetical protein